MTSDGNAVADAFATLGVSEDADEAAIKAAYRRLSKATHPDTPGGDAKSQSALNDALEAALAAVRGRGGALLVVNRLAEVEAVLRRQDVARRTERAAKVIKRERRRRLDAARNLSLFVAACAGAAFLFSDYMLDSAASLISDSIREQAKVAFGLATVGLGAIALWCQGRVQGLEHSIEGFMDEISERRACARYLAAALEFRDRPTITSGDLSRQSHEATSPDDPLALLRSRLRAGLSFALTPDEIQRLLLGKALEHGLIEPTAPEQLAADSEEEYSLRFRPSAFSEPPAAPKAPPTPMTVRESKELVLGGLAMLVLFGGATAYVAIQRHSWWSVLPALPGLLGLILTIGGFAELFGAIRRERS